jgi:hypothetical protein
VRGFRARESGGDASVRDKNKVRDGVALEQLPCKGRTDNPNLFGLTDAAKKTKVLPWPFSLWSDAGQFSSQSFLVVDTMDAETQAARCVLWQYWLQTRQPQ